MKRRLWRAMACAATYLWREGKWAPGLTYLLTRPPAPPREVVGAHSRGGPTAPRAPACCSRARVRSSKTCPNAVGWCNRNTSARGEQFYSHVPALNRSLHAMSHVVCCAGRRRPGGWRSAHACALRGARAGSLMTAAAYHTRSVTFLAGRPPAEGQALRRDLLTAGGAVGAETYLLRPTS